MISEAVYYRRLFISIVASILLNGLFLWAIFTSHFAWVVWFNGKPKPRTVKEIPHLILIHRQPKIPPRTFLETDASQAVKEAPKDATFYSEHSTVATQTTSSEVKPGDIPKANGSNTKTMATETVRLTKPSPQPVQPKSAQAESLKELPVSGKSLAVSAPQVTSHIPQAPPKTGDYTFLKTMPSAVHPTPLEEQSQPSLQTIPQKSLHAPSSPQQLTSRDPIAPVLSSQANPSDPNREVIASMSKLDGGVNRTGKALAFNSAESPFASYDKKIIAKIGVYWQYLVANKFYGEKVGEVEITFKLLADGRVAELHVARNTANAVLAGWCLEAIEKSTPFAPFPESMRAIVGDSREGSLTFAY